MGDKHLFVATEGMYTGQFIYCGAKAQLAIGNILPLKNMPEGTVICNIEHKSGDRGLFAKCSGNSATIISHMDEQKKTQIRLPSGSKKTLSWHCRAMVGIIAAVAVSTSRSSRLEVRSTSTRTRGTA